MQTEIDTGCITTSSASSNIVDTLTSQSTNSLKNTATQITTNTAVTRTNKSVSNATTTATALENVADVTTNNAASYGKISQSDRPMVLTTVFAKIISTLHENTKKGTSMDKTAINSLKHTTPRTQPGDRNVQYHIADGNTASRKSGIAGSAESSLLEGFLCDVNDYVSLSVVM